MLGKVPKFPKGNISKKMKREKKKYENCAYPLTKSDHWQSNYTRHEPVILAKQLNISFTKLTFWVRFGPIYNIIVVTIGPVGCVLMWLFIIFSRELGQYITITFSLSVRCPWQFIRRLTSHRRPLPLRFVRK